MVKKEIQDKAKHFVLGPVAVNINISHVVFKTEWLILKVYCHSNRVSFQMCLYANFICINCCYCVHATIRRSL